jgi:hypothetical protein
MPRHPASRNTTVLESLHSSSFQQRLNMYALAAGAGVSLVALASPSEAEIVYTPADQIVDRHHSYSLDLNHDGIVDYMLVDYANGVSTFATFQELDMKALQGNHVQCVSSDCISTFIYAAALRRGEQVKSSHQRGWCYGAVGPMAFEELVKRGGEVFYSWSWANTNDRYLGLWFKINGENHYGWARLSVEFHPGLPKDRTWEAHLTGYAYETVADQTIKAGQMSDGSEDADAVPPAARPETSITGPSSNGAESLTAPIPNATMGALALGANGISLWRREK